MLTKNKKYELDKAVKLAKAVRTVVDLLNKNFEDWKKDRNKVLFSDDEVLKRMEKTHEMVIDYIHGLLGGNFSEIVKKEFNNWRKA